MKFTLPIIGEIQIGQEKTIDNPVVLTAEAPIIDKTYDVLGGLLSFANQGLSNEKTISSKILEANKEWVYRNNDVIALEVSKINFELFSINLRGGEVVFEAIEDHPLLDLLDRFNPRTTKSDGIYMTQGHKKLAGDAFWWLDKNGDVVENVFILPPDKIELELADPEQTSDLVAAYRYIDTIDRIKVDKRYEPDEIIHFKKPNLKNPFRGFGTVEALAESIDADNLTNETQANFFKRGAISNFVLTTDSKITQEQLKRIQAELRSMYTGAKNAFKVMIFGNGLKPAEVGFSNKDMQFLDLLEWYRDKIMIGFGNTKGSLGIIDDVNRASFETSYNAWLKGTVKPDMDAIVGTINEFLVPMFGENLILGYTDPIEQDITNDVAQSTQLYNADVITRNEARTMIGLDTIDGGDDFRNTPSDTQPQDTTDNPDAAQPEEEKRLYRKAINSAKKNLPPALRHMDIGPVVRRTGIYVKKRINSDLKESVKPIIRRMVEQKKSRQKNDVQNTVGITESIAMEYYEKQNNIVDVFETQFIEGVLKILNEVKEQTLSNFESEIRGAKSWERFTRKKQLFDEDALKVQAQIDLKPILIQELVLAGEAAYDLIGIEDVYVPFKAQESISVMVDKFAESMLDTDKEYLTNIINDGIENGDSIAEITANIQDKFSQYTQIQATRIARTETARVSNLAAEDAFIQSGIVEAKQWLVAPGADEICLQYAGKIVKLKNNFYSPDTSGFQDGNPPLHINCRCKLIPVVVDEAPAIEDQSTKIIDSMSQKIVELESQIDKRTKEFKQMKEESTDDKAYIQALEKYLGVEDE